MQEAVRYVVSAPTGFQSASHPFKSALRSIHDRGLRGEVNVLESLREDGEKLVELTEDQYRAFKAEHPALLIERNIFYKLVRQPSVARYEEIVVAAAASRPVTIRVVDAGGAPVADAEVFVVLDEGRGLVRRGKSGADGKVRTTVPATTTRIGSIVVMPRAQHWNRRISGVVLSGQEITVPLRLLPPAGDEAFDWGHQRTGLPGTRDDGGAGVKIGVIDTGILADHEDLRPAGGRNCVFGEDPGRWMNDDDGHGSHCAGVIAAVVGNGVGVRGYAPKVELRSYRVFAKDSPGAALSDIVAGIQAAIEDGCDILSMSLGSEEMQATIRVKLEAAFEQGVVCFAAAGNEAGPVVFPAAFPTVMAVSAFGRFGTFPADSLHKEQESAHVSADGTCFFAAFSCFGPQVDFCAPGVAIRSTVPGGYGVLDGTSMACPHVAGMAALALSAHPEIAGMPRDGARTAALVKLLRERSTPLGLGTDFEGAGCPMVPALLAP